MTEETNATNNVVQYNLEGMGKVPQYELAGEEISFPLQLDQGGQPVIAYFNMDAQVPAHEIKAFIDEIPAEYEEAAMVDGYTRFQAFHR